MKLKHLLLTTSFLVGVFGSAYIIDTVNAPEPKPKPIFKSVIIIEAPMVMPIEPMVPRASPSTPVVTSQIHPVVPWDSTKRTLLDCDKERQSERIVLACNIYHEARSESDRGQIAVALVTRNRVNSKRYPNTYAKVVWQIRRSTSTNRRVAQFSWALDGKHDKVRDSDAWIKAWNIAGSILEGKIKDFTNGALWYHTKAVKPRWRKKFKVAAIVGDHIFYVKP